jgi:hypothetical protein
MDSSGVEGIHKISPNGKKLAVYEAIHNPKFSRIDATSYFATLGGRVYQLVYPHEELDRYIFTFKPNGEFESAIKLKIDFPWLPSLLAVFPNGEFIVSGLEYDTKRNGAMWPFTGIFSSDGTLLKEVKLQDDEQLHDMAALGDSRVTVPGRPQINRAVTNGYIDIGNDGNAYLMRWTDPAIVYAISSDGRVVHRFPVDPGDPGYRPSAMHIHNGRIAILFVEMQRRDLRMKVGDLQGEEIANYNHPASGGKPSEERVGAAFACYKSSPGAFVFAGAADDSRLQLWLAEGH